MKNLPLILTTVFLTMGFRVIQKKNPWGLSESDPTLYLRLCDEAREREFKKSNIPADDEFGGSSAVVLSDVIETVVADVNAVDSSYLSIEIVGEADVVDEDRLIEFCPTKSDVGAAILDWHGDRAKGCRIDIGGSSHLDESKFFASLFTHELGHCLGFTHAQDTKHGLMSYFHEDLYRLGVDDKMGITYLYPNSENDKYEATYGLSCSPR